MNKIVIFLAWAGILVVSLSTLSFAEVPNKIAFQGMLTDASDTPLTGSYQAVFSIYDVPKGGSPLWQETQTITAKDGLFNVHLGEVTAITLAFDKPYYIDVSVEGELLINRQPLLSVPYALSAKRIEGLTFKDGNVGIGTTGPSHKLGVTGSGNTAIIALYPTFEDGDYGAIRAQFGAGDVSAPSEIRFYRKGWGSDIRFVTYSPGGASNGEVMTIANTGNVGIGTTSPGATLEIKAGGTTLADAWTPRSSRRWKENIKPIEGALDKVKSLRGVYFDWKASGKHDMGLIAEEVGEVIPEVVTYEDNAKDAKSLDYDRLVAVLIEAVKDQQQQLDELKQELQSLKQSH